MTAAFLTREGFFRGPATFERVENKFNFTRCVYEGWWRVKICRSKDVPWRVKCRRMVEHVYSVFCFGSENWSWNQSRQNQRMGNEGDESFISNQKGRRGDVGKVLHKNSQENVGKNEVTIFCLK